MNLKLFTTIALIMLTAIFIIQNTMIVELHLFFWKIAMSRALMFAFLVVIGIAIGWLLRGHKSNKPR